MQSKPLTIPLWCAGAYEIKVSIENRACTSVGDIIYRRHSDPDVTGLSNFFTIQGVDESFFDFASNRVFCSGLPSEPCPTFDEPPFENVGPKDQGHTFDINLGELGPGERVIFRMYYGVFEDEDSAKECIDSARVNLFALARDDINPVTYMFGFRRSVTKVSSSAADDCVVFENSPSLPEADAAPFAFSATMSEEESADMKEEMMLAEEEQRR